MTDTLDPSDLKHEAAIEQNAVVIYTTRFCPYCIGAKQLLIERQRVFHEICVDFNPKLRALMAEKANGRTSVPQIWIHQQHIGGYDDLVRLDAMGGLAINS